MPHIAYAPHMLIMVSWICGVFSVMWCFGRGGVSSLVPARLTVNLQKVLLAAGDCGMGKRQSPWCLAAGLHDLSDLAENIRLLLLAGTTTSVAFAQGAASLRQGFVRAEVALLLHRVQMGLSISQALNCYLRHGGSRLSGANCSALVGKGEAALPHRTSLLEERFCDFVRLIAVSLSAGHDLTSSLLGFSERCNGEAGAIVLQHVGRAPVKMIFPLVFFILPVVIMIFSLGAVREFLRLLG